MLSRLIKNPIQVQNQRRLHIDFYKNRVLEKYAAKNVVAVTLRQLTKFGRTELLNEEKLVRSGILRLTTANYIREELPVRLAHRIRMFQQLPFVVGTNPHIEMVYKLYWEAFEEFRNYPAVHTMEENLKFCEFVQNQLNVHAIVIPHLVVGMYESQSHVLSTDCNKFMNETLRSRISRRVLAEQHIALSSVQQGTLPTSEGMIGILNTSCKAADVVHKCYRLAGELFAKTYDAEAPELIVDGHLNASFVYIPDHIEYIMYELFKNSMKYTLKSHADEDILPPIRVTIGVGDNQVMFRVSDEGGGIDKDAMSNLWNFVKPTAGELYQQKKLLGKIEDAIPLDIPLGIGLSLSRVYANYWGGSLSLYSMFGYGTDAYVTISTGNALENLSFIEDAA
ncbi:hypothetical protein HDV01_002407 [Terramyces sp. JEL0728]|nr:hypothetical protein HDV01_002407 [Terramyces sp. JEL0728]